ncbi:MAG: hypothetical protein A2293_12085 [Elusimicrobia bacterium RIFOXYB2_FULL_49_7]|nr:MAG: hypothetical protein A2293_12085 [Elusimicrobia bacterium RIFOXYB2_FULL_49_7]
MKPSFIYRRLFLYRLVMTLLYRGRYRCRAREMSRLFRPEHQCVLELCFGDTLIAVHCRDTGRQWTGLDVNPTFVTRAKKDGHDAHLQDIFTIETLPVADVCVMMGSFYHFHDQAVTLLKRMMTAAPEVILSEPVRNLSSRRGLIGFLAKRAANAGKGAETFRYNETNFKAMLNNAANKVGFTWEQVQLNRDMIVRLVRESA